MEVNRRGFLGLAGCCAGVVAATAACSATGHGASTGDVADPSPAVPSADEAASSSFEDIHQAFFDQVIADRTDIKLYTWQDARSGARGYGGAEYPRGAYFPHSVYVGDLDGDGVPELLYLAAHQDHGVMLGCRLKLFKFDEKDRTCHMAFSSPTFPDPLPACSWQPGDPDVPWSRPEVCWDRLDTEVHPGTTDFILFTVSGEDGLFALISFLSPETITRYLVHMVYDVRLGTLVTVEDPWVRVEGLDDSGEVMCWHGTSPVSEEDYQEAEDQVCRGSQEIVTFNGTGLLSDHFESMQEADGPVLTPSAVNGRQAMSFGVSLAYLGASINKRAVFVGDGDVEVLPYDFEDLVLDRSPFVYQPRLAHVLMALACSAYDIGDVADSLASLGFTADMRAFNYHDDPLTSLYGPDQVAFALGLCQTADGNALLVVVLRGSYPDFQIPLPADWSSNFNMGSALHQEGEHEGFSAAADEVYEHIDMHMRDFHELTGETTTVLICGHSRGAAVGNLLARRLLDTWANDAKLYCYNFSCPDTARYADNDWTRDGAYNGIFNVSDTADGISWVPGVLGDVASGFGGLIGGREWNDIIATWGKFGHSMWFLNEDYQEGSRLNPFTGHSPKNCLDFLSALPEKDDLMTSVDVALSSRPPLAHLGHEVVMEIVGAMS